jgi:hypothetical protein
VLNGRGWRVSRSASREARAIDSERRRFLIAVYCPTCWWPQRERSQGRRLFVTTRRSTGRAGWPTADELIWAIIDARILGYTLEVTGKWSETIHEGAGSAERSLLEIRSSKKKTPPRALERTGADPPTQA